MNNNLNIVENGAPITFVLKRRQQYRKINCRPNEDNRVMSKRGRVYVYLAKIPEKYRRYVTDLWRTLVNMQWRWLLGVVALINTFAYFVFSILFLADSWISGDFNDDPEHKTCIKGINNYISFLMLGIETITTTGYGYFYPTEYCKLVFVVLLLSTWVMIFIDGAFISVVYAKITKPSYKSDMFSKKAIVTFRNGKCCLVFRVNDHMSKHWIDTKISVFLVEHHHKTKEGEVIFNYIVELEVQKFGMLFWPVDIVHEINNSSPLWNLSAHDFITKKFEFLVVLTGGSIVTGNNSKSQTSYLSTKDILWGYRFNSVLEYSVHKNVYIVNTQNFNKTIVHEMPLCSASHLDKLEREVRRKNRSLIINRNCDKNKITSSGKLNEAVIDIIK